MFMQKVQAAHYIWFTRFEREASEAKENQRRRRKSEGKAWEAASGGIRSNKFGP
jgi:hypothetical protein